MNSPGLLEALFPSYDARERHEVMVHAPASTVYAALREADFARSRVVRVLLALRSLPFVFQRTPRSAVKPLRFSKGVESLLAAGFGLLAERPGSEIVFGLAGPFWRLRPRAFALSADDARAGPVRGTAHAGWNFRVSSAGAAATRLVTETRVIVGDDSSRRRFLTYWVIVRPFSGLIRRSMLRAVKHTAERACIAPPPDRFSA